MTAALLDARELRKRYGAFLATDRVSLSVAPGELHALIGPNGAGKTTLLGLLAGQIAPDAGRIVLRGEDITRQRVARRAQCGVGRSFQIASVFPTFCAAGNVALPVQGRAGHSFRFWEPAAEVASLRAPARAILSEVGLGGREETLASAMAHGELRQLELAMALASGPTLLLLDEPTAGLSAGESAEMARFLASLKRRFGILLVEHDMDVVFALADRISVLADGRIIASGRPSEIRASREVREAYLGEALDA